MDALTGTKQLAHAAEVFSKAGSPYSLFPGQALQSGLQARVGTKYEAWHSMLCSRSILITSSLCDEGHGWPGRGVSALTGNMMLFLMTGERPQMDIVVRQSIWLPL